MKSHTLFPLLHSLTLATTVWLAGDSTMAPGGGGHETAGWGDFLRYSFDPDRVTIKNKALAGRSARSYTNEGHFQEILNKIRPGHWLLAELGHNDGANPRHDPKCHGDCPGSGSEVCEVTCNNKTEFVQTYSTYLRNVTSLALSRGAYVIISSQTPNNPWESGSFTWSSGRFQDYAMRVVEEMGGPEKKVYFVNHGNYSAQAARLLGKDVVNRNYPRDHTHTAPYLAEVYAGAFVRGLLCGTAGLKKKVVNETLDESIYGGCEATNSTLSIYRHRLKTRGARLI